MMGLGAFEERERKKGGGKKSYSWASPRARSRKKPSTFSLQFNRYRYQEPWESMAKDPRAFALWHPTSVCMYSFLKSRFQWGLFNNIYNWTENHGSLAILSMPWPFNFLFSPGSSKWNFGFQTLTFAMGHFLKPPSMKSQCLEPIKAELWEMLHIITPTPPTPPCSGAPRKRKLLETIWELLVESEEVWSCIIPTEIFQNSSLGSKLLVYI